MKLRKKTGIMMAATAAVAVVGVAAVSFAAWTGSNTTLTATASTGSAYLFGFEAAQTEALPFSNKLVPWDQPTTSIKEGAKIVSLQLPTYTVYGDYSINVRLNSNDYGLVLYAYVGAEQTEAKNPAGVTGWQQITTADTEYPFDTETKGEVANTYISLLLVSADSNQQDKSFDLSVTLENRVTETA